MNIHFGHVEKEELENAFKKRTRATSTKSEKKIKKKKKNTKNKIQIQKQTNKQITGKIT
jgi:hypothetical protein